MAWLAVMGRLGACMTASSHLSAAIFAATVRHGMGDRFDASEMLVKDREAAVAARSLTSVVDNTDGPKTSSTRSSDNSPQYAQRQQREQQARRQQQARMQQQAQMQQHPQVPILTSELPKECNPQR